MLSEVSLFELALQTPEGERAALLDRECGTDVVLRARIEALLAADQEAAGWLTSPYFATGPFGHPEQQPFPQQASLARTVIAGRYTLLQLIGEGGMGSVWLALQHEPVKRQVAVKLIRAERGNSKAILARFEAERQASALMDHPHIAKLLDAGTTEAGQPFCVMELVKGVPLNQFCDANRLSIPERLRLFVQICSAVQHAHQKGIIHRDLKPGNILVETHDGKPIPRVIDFGLAKAIGGGQLTENSLNTAFGSVVGTPLYMAPEQARFDAVDVDTRADIYALGVILYELLSGTTPLTRATLKQAAADEVFRLIREEEPPTPSSRIGTAAAEGNSSANRPSTPEKLERIVKGELDWIALKALAKERDQRYETARDFAQDIERFLKHEPVSAGPPSASYRFRKFVRRHRPQVIAACLVLLTLLLGIVGTTIGLFHAERARQDAVWAAEQEQEARKAEEAARSKETEERKYAEAIAAFVREDFLALTSIEGQSRFGGGQGPLGNPNLTLLEMLDRAANKLDSRRDLAPRIEADLRWMIGVNYRGQGDGQKAARHLQKCLDLRRQLLGVDHLDTLNAQNSLGYAYHEAGRLDRALPLLEESLRLHQDTFGSDHSSTTSARNNLAVAYLDTGSPEKGMPLLEKSLGILKSSLGPHHENTLLGMHNLARGYLAIGKLEEALPLCEETLRLRKGVLGPDHPDTLTSLFLLASTHHLLGNPDQALPLFEKTLERKKVRLGTNHPYTLAAMRSLATVYIALGKLDQAFPLLEEAVKQYQLKRGPHHPDTLGTQHDLGVAFLAQGNLERATPLLQETLRHKKARQGSQHPDTLGTMSYLGLAYQTAGKHDLALPLFEEVLHCHKTQLGCNHPDYLLAMNNLAVAFHSIHRLDRSIPLFEEALLQYTKKLGRDDVKTQHILANLGINYRDVGKLDKALPLLEEAYRFSQGLPPFRLMEFPAFRELGLPLLDIYATVGKRAEAVKLARELLAHAAKQKPVAPVRASQPLESLSRFSVSLLNAEAFADVEPLLRECLAFSQKMHPEEWITFDIQSALGGALAGLKKYGEAEPLLLVGYQGLKKHEKAIPKGRDALAVALDRLIRFYTMTNKPDEVKKFQAERAKHP